MNVNGHEMTYEVEGTALEMVNLISAILGDGMYMAVMLMLDNAYLKGKNDGINDSTEALQVGGFEKKS